MPKQFQLELIGNESEDQLDKKLYPWDAIIRDGVERSKYFYEPEALDAVTGACVTNPVKNFEEKQLELYEIEP